MRPSGIPVRIHSFGTPAAGDPPPPMAEGHPAAPEQVEVARLTAENERLEAEAHAAKCYLGEARASAIALTAERDALAKRVEALRVGLEGIRDGAHALIDAEERARVILLADNKAAT